MNHYVFTFFDAIEPLPILPHVRILQPFENGPLAWQDALAILTINEEHIEQSALLS